ncbi:MAG: amino acid permease [Holosporaceae bacterium]|jgi:APA family basic amino acid/polyamine antiporter|nr:amino acid permease [Holosporaceae bacterium]
MAKKMGFWPVLSIVFGSQIGSGIFVLPASLAPYGFWGILGWCLAGLGAIMLAMVFAELCTRFPEIGGPHKYVQMVFGRMFSFYIGWAYWLVSWVSSTVLVILSVSYLSPITGIFSPAMTFMLEVGLLAVVCAINCKSVELSGRVEFVLTLMKFVPFVVVPALIIGNFDASNIMLAPEYESTSILELITKVTVLCFWGFIGVECATTPAGNVKNPGKTIPNAIIVGTCGVALVYIVNSVTIMGVIPGTELAVSNAPFVDAIKVVVGKNMSILLSIIASIVCIGTLNAWTLTSAQISLGLAQDGLLPEIFARKNSSGSPYAGVIISSIGMLPIILLTKSDNFSAQINYIVDFSVKAFLVIYMACCIAFLGEVIRDRKIGKAIVGIVAMAFCALMVVESTPQSLLVAATFFVSGIFMLPFIKRGHGETGGDKSTKVLSK